MFIFLDIDGVLVTTPPWRSVVILDDDFSAFNSKAASNLNEILEKRNSRVFLTSSHKHRFSIQKWKSIFIKRGILINHLDILPTYSSSLSRNEQIIYWLKQNPVEDFVIIDDDTSLCDLPSVYKNRLVLTRPLIGLCDDSKNFVLEILSCFINNHNSISAKQIA